MSYNKEIIQEVEDFAKLNYSPKQIAKILQLDYDEFLYYWQDADNAVRIAYDRGQLLAVSGARRNIVDSASSSITAAQEYKKMLDADRIEQVKQDMDSSIEPPKSEAALQLNYKDSIDYYHQLTDFINTNSEQTQFPPELEAYWHRLNTAHDLQTRFANRAKGRKYMVKVLRKKFPDIGEAVAYRLLYESLNFFAVNLKRPQWRNILTEDLEKAKTLAWSMNRVDWFIKAVKEQAEIQQVKLPEPETIDPELLQEKVLLIVNDPGALSSDMKKIPMDKILDKIKEFDIEFEDKIRIAKDAGIEDVDFEEIFNPESNEEEVS